MHLAYLILASLVRAIQRRFTMMLPRISTFTVSESLLRVLELRLKVLAPNQFHPPGVNWFL